MNYKSKIKKLHQIIQEDENTKKFIRKSLIRIAGGLGVGIAGHVVGKCFDYGVVDNIVRYVGYAGSLYGGLNFGYMVASLQIRKRLHRSDSYFIGIFSKN